MPSPPFVSPGGDADQVEVERIDPMKVVAQSMGQQPGAPPAPAAGKPMGRDAHLEPLLPRSADPAAQSPPPPPPPLPKALDSRALPDKPPEPIDALINDDVITRLLKKFGIDQERVIDVELGLYDTTLRVGLRIPDYDDYIWALSVLERKSATQEDASMLMTPAQRQQVLDSTIACRCVVTIDGVFIWDVFSMVDQVKVLVPGWDGRTRTKIPDFFQGTLALSVESLFRRMHPELMFLLAKRAKELDVEEHARRNAKKPTAPKATPEDPSSAT